MDKLIPLLKKRLPGVQFIPGDAFFWSPADSKVVYHPGSAQTDVWSLLHESAHALLGHTDYQQDIDLLLLEVEAWQTAKKIAEELGITIDENHIQDCLDTYRDWLHQRSTCPRCSTVSLQINNQRYSCHNCSATWHVSSSRFCRPYRLSNTTRSKKSPEPIAQATFQ